MSSSTTLATAATALGTALGTLVQTPGAWSLFGHKISSSNEGKAIDLIDKIQMSPTLATAFLTQLAAIPNMPDQVMTWVEDAVANPTGPDFHQDLNQAKTVLAASVATGLFG